MTGFSGLIGVIVVFSVLMILLVCYALCRIFDELSDVRQKIEDLPNKVDHSSKLSAIHRDLLNLPEAFGREVRRNQF